MNLFVNLSMNLFVQLAYLVLLLVNLQICETYGDVNKEKTEFWEHGAIVQGVVLTSMVPRSRASCYLAPPSTASYCLAPRIAA
jgi:hypothetical protein